MQFFELAFLVWFYPEQAFRRLRGFGRYPVALVWLAATAPLMLLAAGKTAVVPALALRGLWTAGWLVSACLIHALALRRFSRPLLRGWRLLSAWAHLPVWVMTPFAAVGPKAAALALLGALAWVLLLEGQAVKLLYNRTGSFALGAVLLPRLLPLAAGLFALGALLAALVSLFV